MAEMGLYEKIIRKMLGKSVKTSVSPRHDDGICLGWGYDVTDEWNKKEVYIPEKILNMHTYILGSTGSGKSVLLRQLAYQLIQQGYGVLVIDLKGEDKENDKGERSAEFLWDMWRACYKTKREDDFIYFSPVENDKFLQKSATWNPLIRGSADIIAARVMRAFGRDNNPAAAFYEDVKFDVLFALFSAMKSTGKVFTFRDISHALSSSEVLGKLGKTAKDTDAKKLINEMIESWDGNSMQFVKNTAGIKVLTREMAYGMVGGLCNAIKPTLDLADAVAKKRVIYTYLPTMLAARQMRNIAKMMLAELLTVFSDIQSAGKQSTKFAIIVDEAEELTFNDVKDLFNKARSAGVSIIWAHQSLADINYAMHSVEFTKSLLDNTATKIVMRIKSAESAEMMAKTVGELPEMPLLNKYISQRYIIPPGNMMMKNDIYPQGLDVGEFYAKVDNGIYRVKTPYPKSREKIIVGKDIPYPNLNYKEMYFGEALDLEKQASLAVAEGSGVSAVRSENKRRRF